MDEKMAAAVEAVKSSQSSFSKYPYRAVNSGLATRTLAKELGIEEGEAKQLCISAVEDHFDGYSTTREYKGGLRGGLPPARRVVDEWWVDRSKL